MKNLMKNNLVVASVVTRAFYESKSLIEGVRGAKDLAELRQVLAKSATMIQRAANRLD